MRKFFAQRRFRDVVRRQIALFHDEQVDLVSQAREALRDALAEGDQDRSREIYERYEDLSEDLEQALADMRDAFARSVSEDLEDAYRSEFVRQVRRAYKDVTPGFGPDSP